MTKQEFVKAMTFLGNAYSKKFNEEELTTWYFFMKDYPFGEFLEAIRHLVKTQKYMPSISEVCEAITVGDISEAENEFEKVRGAIREFGSYRIPELLDSLNDYTREILRICGGVNRVASATPDQITWLRKEFIAEYKANKRNLPLLERATNLRLENKKGN